MLYEDRSLVLAAALDSSASMFVGRERTSYARGTDALEAWYELADAEDRCVRIRGSGPLGDARRRGRAAARLCMTCDRGPRVSFTTTLRVALATVPPDASLLIVSDFFEVADALPPLVALAQRADVTALVVRDPWYAGLPLGGFVWLRDAESGAVERLFIGAAERRRYERSVVQREADVLELLRRAGIRGGVLADAAQNDLLRTFGLLPYVGR